jgi:hypothetical protein
MTKFDVEFGAAADGSYCRLQDQITRKCLR